MIKTTDKKLTANTNSIKIDTKVICLSCLRSLDAYDVVYKIDHPRANVSFLMCLDCFIKIKNNPMYFDDPNTNKTSISDKSSVNKNSPINNEKGGKNNEKTKDRIKTGTKSSGL